MREWLRKQWNDIKGNVKYGAIVFVAGVALTAVGILTHGLTWWQQSILLFVFGLVLAWAIAATVLSIRRSKSNAPHLSPPTTKTPVSLRERVFVLCNEMSAYAGERQQRPDEEKLFAQYGNGGKEFAEHYDAEIQSWDDKLSAGYWLYFRDRACNLRHELVINGASDGILDKALSDLDREAKRGYTESLRTLMERLRYAASTLP